MLSIAKFVFAWIEIQLILYLELKLFQEIVNQNFWVGLSTLSVLPSEYILEKVD